MASDVRAEEANARWADFAKEDEEAGYVNNNYGEKQGPTLHFYTLTDLFLDGKWLIETNRKDLGVKRGMSAQEAANIYAKEFPAWSTTGNCELKLSGMYYCPHTLAKVTAFLMINKGIVRHNFGEFVTGQDKETWQEHVIRYGAPVLATRYCKECKRIADRLGILLPIEPNNATAHNRAFRKLRDAGELADGKYDGLQRKYLT